MVLEAVYHSQGHLTVDEVHTQVQAKSPFVDLATTYRTLLMLKQHGVVGELRREGEPVRYEAVHSGHEHHHAVCSQCGRIIEIPAAELAALQQHLRVHYGFHANLVHWAIPGLCAECAAAPATT
jgi:Fur family ferric uptake transcriptional regulator